MKSEYEYEVDVNPLRPPLGTLTHVGKLGLFIRRDKDGKVTHLPSPVGEVYGHDTSEAHRKARDAIDAWIAAQPK